MDNKLFKLLDKKVEKINPRVGNGLATEQLEHALPYYRSILRQVEKGFIPGLTFVECVRCTPKEEYDRGLLIPPNRCEYETAKSDFFMVKLKLAYNGVELPYTYLYLPFIRNGGILQIRGSRFSVTPVLIDKAFSVDSDNLFIPFTRDKLTFKRIGHSFKLNGKRETRSVVWSKIHRPKHQGKPGAGRHAFPTLVNYLLCEYGLSTLLETVGKIPRDSFKIGKYNMPSTLALDTNDWEICKSTGIPPSGWPKNVVHERPDICIAIRKGYYTDLVSSIITGLFYISDHYAQRLTDPTCLDEKLTWVRILGVVYDGSNAIDRPERRLIEGMEDHLASLDGYMDELVIKMLRDEGVFCTSMPEFMVYVMENMSNYVISANPANLYGKRLVTLYYVMFDVVADLFRFLFAIQAKVKNGITEVEIIGLMRKKILSETAFGIGKGHHGEVKSVGVPNDNMLPLLTSRMIPQNKATRVRKRGNANDPTLLADASWAECTGYTVQPKSEPTGRGSLSLYVKLSPTGILQQRPEAVDKINDLNSKLRRK